MSPHESQETAVRACLMLVREWIAMMVRRGPLPAQLLPTLEELAKIDDGRSVSLGPLMAAVERSHSACGDLAGVGYVLGWFWSQNVRPNRDGSIDPRRLMTMAELDEYICNTRASIRGER